MAASGNNRLVAVAGAGAHERGCDCGGLRALTCSESDGTVWAWGNNAQGQLGDGTTTFRVSPGAGAGT